jgi:hypothetical protein
MADIKVSAFTQATTAGSEDEFILVQSGVSKRCATKHVANAGTRKQFIIIDVGDETSAITVGTNKKRFRLPQAFVLSEVRASLNVAQASGTIFTVDINDSGTTILSTKITIDNTEKTSKTAAIPHVLGATSIPDDVEISIDVDQIGDGTAVGLKVYLIGKTSTT